MPHESRLNGKCRPNLKRIAYQSQRFPIINFFFIFGFVFRRVEETASSHHLSDRLIFCNFLNTNNKKYFSPLDLRSGNGKVDTRRNLPDAPRSMLDEVILLFRIFVIKQNIKFFIKF